MVKFNPSVALWMYLGKYEFRRDGYLSLEDWRALSEKVSVDFVHLMRFVTNSYYSLKMTGCFVTLVGISHRLPLLAKESNMGGRS